MFASLMSRQWVDILSNEKGQEEEFPEGLVCYLAEQQLVAAKFAKLTIFYMDDGVRRVTLQLRLEPDMVVRIVTAGMWGLPAEFTANLDQRIQVTMELEVRAELMARYHERLKEMENKSECLMIVEGARQFPEFLKLGNYNLISALQ